MTGRYETNLDVSGEEIDDLGAEGKIRPLTRRAPEAKGPPGAGEAATPELKARPDDHEPAGDRRLNRLSPPRRQVP